jgi:hypothetical protein
MESKTLLRVLGLLMLLGFAPLGIKAQSPDEVEQPAWFSEVPCKADLLKRVVINSDVIVCLQYDEKQLQLRPGGHIADLVITSYTAKGSLNPEIKDVSVLDPGHFSGLIVGLNSGPRSRSGRLTSQSEYSYDLRIGNDIRPDIYDLTLTSAQADRTDKVKFKLPFWRAEGEWIDLTRDSQKSLSCWSGNQCSPLKLFLLNKLPYKLTISKVSIISDPADLLEDHPQSTTPQSIDAVPSDQEVDLLLKAKTVSFTRAFSGFGKFPRATMLLTYRDDLGRELTKRVELDLEVKPNLLLLIITLLLGAIVGTVVRIDLRRLQKAGLITRRQKFVFAGTTFATGVIVCLIALFANLKFTVFDAQSPYSTWDPKILFLMGLVGTIGGIPILYSLLKLPTPTDNEPGDEK